MFFLAINLQSGERMRPAGRLLFTLLEQPEVWAIVEDDGSGVADMPERYVRLEELTPEEKGDGKATHRLVALNQREKDEADTRDPAPKLAEQRARIIEDAENQLARLLLPNAVLVLMVGTDLNASAAERQALADMRAAARSILTARDAALAALEPATGEVLASPPRVRTR